MNQNKLFVFFQDSKIVIKNLIYPNTQIYLQYLRAESSFMSIDDICKKIVSGEANSTICISNLETLLNTLSQLNRNRYHSKKIENNILQFEDHIIKIKEKFPETFIIGNIYDIGEQYNTIERNISQLPYYQQNDTYIYKYKAITEISKSIYNINCHIDNFFNIFNSFKGTQIKILDFLRKVIILIQNLLIQPENYTTLATISSLKLSTVLINENQEPILHFEQTFCERNFIDQTIQFFCDIFKEQIGEEMNNNFYCEIKQYMIKDFLLFVKDLSWIKDSIYKQSLTINYYLSLFNFLSTRIEWIMKSLKNQILFDQTKIDFYLLYLQYISKGIFSFDVQTILIILNSISKMLKKYVDESAMTQTYADFLTFYFQENPSSMNPNETLYTNFVYSLNEIQMQKKYFFIDKLFHFLIKNFLDSKLFMKKYQTNFVSNCKIFKVISKDMRSNRLYVDNEMKFYVLTNFGSSSKAMNIMKKNYSKFIVHFDENDQKCVLCNYTVPYFPMKSLAQIYKTQNKNRIYFSNVDKIVIILEIATALDDLHSNNEFHGKISDRFIYISSNKDAYIGKFLEDGDIKKSSKFDDIKHFGELISEFILGEKKQCNDIKNDACSFLLNKKYIKSMGNDDLIGMKEIINKCLKNDANEQYSNMKEIIESIKKLRIYQQNKDEIEYRFTHSIDAREYKCTISDIIEGYYRGNFNPCLRIIDNFIKSFKKNTLYQSCIYCDNYIFYSSKELNNAIIKIYNLFDVRNSIEIISDCEEYISDESSDKFWMKIFSKIRNHVSQDIIHILKMMSNFYDDESKQDSIISRSFKEFIVDYNLELSPEITNQKNKEFFYDIQQHKKFYYIDNLFQIIIKNLLDHKLFTIKYQISFDFSMNFRICQLDNSISSSDLYFNKFFYAKNRYPDKIDKKELKRIKDLLKRNYSKFIFVDQGIKLDEYISDIEIRFPYMPSESLDRIIETTYLTIVDKIIIILEIATALDDLHKNNEYHGNLHDNFIQINSKLDAYFQEFYYDSDFFRGSKFEKALFTRSPELFSEDRNDFNIRQKQLSDIFSFGVLMHEILTETRPQSRFVYFPLYERLHIIQSNYSNFLFSGRNNECFDDDDLIEMKEIINKCLKNDANEQYSNMKEIIESIKKLRIYQQNKDEIEYRFTHSIDAREYKCTISDIIEGYYKGDHQCYVVIQIIFNKLKYGINQEICQKFRFDGDIIKLMLFFIEFIIEDK